ncbi:hypothetical protein GF376_00895 [Candidatus Peregrinibacteria bacterium]|nr:hypothetical protein [Candidatus Peregrinibacteria bacterium]
MLDSFPKRQLFNTIDSPNSMVEKATESQSTQQEQFEENFLNTIQEVNQLITRGEKLEEIKSDPLFERLKSLTDSLEALYEQYKGSESIKEKVEQYKKNAQYNFDKLIDLFEDRVESMERRKALDDAQAKMHAGLSQAFQGGYPEKAMDVALDYLNDPGNKYFMKYITAGDQITSMMDGKVYGASYNGKKWIKTDEYPINSN